MYIGHDGGRKEFAMKKAKLLGVCVIFLLLFFAPQSVFARGVAEITEEPVPVNPEHILLITSLDVSGLPLARQLIGETVVRSLAASISTINYRLRGEDEAEYYKLYTWENARAQAAQTLRARRADRDQIVFRGDPSWRDRRSLQVADEAIAAAELHLREVEATFPVVEGRPLFRLSSQNLAGDFPNAPRTGEEFRFALQNNVDAFMVGSLSEFHGRVLLEVMIYSRHSREFSYHYSVLFSSADLIEAVDEIADHLILAISGIQPAGILVQTDNPDAVILVDGTFFGRGSTEMRTHFPGEVLLEVQAENYTPVSFPIMLNPGELAEVFIDLTPLGVSAFEVIAEDNPGSLVFQGGLFIGHTPLIVEVPHGQFAYITVETPDGDVGTLIYHNNNLIRGDARFVINGADPSVGATAFVRTRPPIMPEHGRVERARRNFYRAYGALWIILPLSLLTAGVANTHIQANNMAMAGVSGAPTDLDTLQRIYNNAVIAHNVRMAAFGVMGVSLGVTFFQIFRYLRAASADATPLVPQPVPAVVTVEDDYDYDYPDYEAMEEDY